MLYNYAQTFLGDLWGTLEPEVTYRGAGSVVEGDFVAFPTDFAAYTNDSAAVSNDRTSANFLWANVVGMTQANTELGILGVVKRGGSAGAKIQVSIFNSDILCKVVGGTGVAEAAGQFMLPMTAIATPAVTAKELKTFLKSDLDSVTAPVKCFGFTLEAAPDTTPAVKRCFFDGTGLFVLSGGA